MPFTALYGSPDEVNESFYYAVNRILLRRGVYLQDKFFPVEKHGMELSATNEIEAFMKNTEAALRYFMRHKQLTYVTVQLLDCQNDTSGEQWVFRISNEDGGDVIETPDAEERFQNTMTFVDAKCDQLDALDGPGTFKVLIHLEQNDDTHDNLYEICDPQYMGPDVIFILDEDLMPVIRKLGSFANGFGC